jgi:SdrD B-like domain
MRFLRNTRALVALGVLLGATLCVVIPALATAPGAPILPPSSAGITPVDVPTGGQNTDCSVFGSTATNSYRIVNPKDGIFRTTASDGTKVSFTIDMDPSSATGLPAYAADKYVSFTSTGASVYDLGIKGGTDSARYNYTGVTLSNPNLGGVGRDGNLHAPAQSTGSDGQPTQLYSVSQLTFCYVPAGSIAGTVYEDNTKPANGTQDAGDPGLAGWSVNLYDNGTQIRTATTASDGSYAFVLPLATADTYTVCEAPPSGAWAQSQPLPSSPNVCTGANELAKGYALHPTSSSQALTASFGNVPSVACQTGPFGTADGNYLIQLASCKPTQFVFDSGTLANGNPFVSTWTGDQTQGLVPIVEKIGFPDPIVSGQPSFTKLLYTDTFPFSTANLAPMQYCKLDPRTGEFTLDPAYDQASEAGAVLPGTATSCAISITTSVDASGHGRMLAYVYSAVDGLRTTG